MAKLICDDCNSPIHALDEAIVCDECKATVCLMCSANGCLCEPCWIELIDGDNDDDTDYEGDDDGSE